ncbi:MAG: amidohydrolase/deacetylase family metallohydrolase [Candidatus Latescibacterota bacterium]|nr:amidohydrolase/deacetylase family metallohydrolase [Candidatus Latescibacterota bacterium]
MKYDLLIQGGTLVDPAQGVNAVRDVVFVDGEVTDVGENLAATEAREVIDASGRYVTPGLIDVHVHVFPGVSFLGVEPDPTCLARGVTTVVDAGSAGADTFPGFRKYVIEVSQTRILAQLNISSQGMLSRHVGEFALPEYADVDACCRMIEQHRDLILGVKVRLTKNSIVAQSAGMTPLHRAREAADAAGLPIMVHPQAAWCDSIDDILKVMKKGDILTHTFHGSACGIMDGDSGKVRASVLDAIERGVIFDVGHGAGSFSWDVVEAAMAEGVLPMTISSDLHTGNINGPVYDLANILTKFLHLGLSLDDVLARVTSVPAAAVLMQDRIGTLAPGAWGDAVVFELREGTYNLEDCHGGVRTGMRSLEPVIVIKDGRVYREEKPS